MKRSWESLVRKWLDRSSRRSARRRTCTLLPSAVEVLEVRSLLSAAVSPAASPDTASSAAQANTADSALQQIDHFVIIYQENWSFDGLYGSFPGANGIANASQASLTQLDRVTGQPLTTSLPIYPGQTNDPSIPDNTVTDAPSPYNLGQYLQPSDKTGDIVHRYFQEQSQIDHGAMDKFIGWSDNTQAVMSHFDATNLPEGLLAQQYTMDDNFFHAAFGGSFLNHQFLVAAAAPVYPDAPMSMIAVLGPDGQLLLNSNGGIVHDGNITPMLGVSFGDPNQTYDKNYAINTIFSKNLSPSFIGNNTAASLLPSQNDSDPTKPNYIPTIGDSLDQAGVSWKWYSGGWDAALASSPSNPANNGTTPANPTVDPLFQWHHQPLAYYDNFAPWLSNGQRNPLSAAHLQDENSFFTDLSNGDLPAVSFVKPLGPDNEHPGYTNLLRGQQHVADIVHAVQNSADWAHTAIIITYDENGGRWDHVSAPDANGIWGDGSRVPGIVISPYAKQGYVDHTQHDTLSILKTIEQRFNLPALNQLDANASSLANDFQSTANVSIGKAYLQPDANTIGSNVLVVFGTPGSDEISIDETGAGANARLVVNIDGTVQKFSLSQVSRIQIFGQGGNDQIDVSSQVSLPAMIFTGNGNDEIQTGSGNSIVVGGNGDNQINGGAGRNILIGGTGNSEITETGGQAILIGGVTSYDSNAEALTAIENEWASADDLATRVLKIRSGVSQDGAKTLYHLGNDTVFANGFVNQLSGDLGMNWFFADPTKDEFTLFGQDVLTPISP
jgi:phospholipase C